MGMAKVNVIIIFVLLINLPVFSQSNHQRIGVEKKEKHTITAAIDVSYNYSEKTHDRSHYIGYRFSLSYMYLNRFSIQTSIPFVFRIEQVENPAERLSFAYGDPEVSMGIIKRVGDYKLKLEGIYQYPLGIWNPYQIGNKGLAGGQGYHKGTVSFGAAKIIDPVVLNALLSYTIGFPRKERFGWSTEPGEFALDFGYTEVLNDEIGINIGIKQEIVLPAIISGKYDYRDTIYRLFLNLALMYNLDNIDIQLYLGNEVTDIISNPVSGIKIYYDFDF